MTTLVYDGSFEGLLTAVFEVFEYQLPSPQIVSAENYVTENIFAEVHQAITQT